MLKMTDFTAEYIHLKEIDPQPAWQSVKRLVLVAGDKTVDQYNRLDARSFVNSYDGSVKTTIIDTAVTPIHIIVGAYDLTCTPEDAERTARAIPGATLAIMGELGHFPMSEHPAGFRPFFVEALEKMPLHPAKAA